MNDPKLTTPLAHYAHTSVAGSLVFVAGQGARDPETNSYLGVSLAPDGKVKSYDAGIQARAVLANIERALQKIGLSRANIVDVQIFLKDMADFASMNAAWNEFFLERTDPPSRTTVAVKDLPGHNSVEMKAVAYRGSMKD